VTKLAGERLSLDYYDVFGVPTTILRYFSVYGPRHRPDMGYYIFIDRIVRGEPIIIYGDGEQTRGNTFVSDCVEATLLAAEKFNVGEVYNIGGGEARSVNWVIATIEKPTGRRAVLASRRSTAGRSSAHHGQHRQGSPFARVRAQGVASRWLGGSNRMANRASFGVDTRRAS
jgi:nucleoside-diphosphate-sugar epimerase